MNNLAALRLNRERNKAVLWFLIPLFTTLFASSLFSVLCNPENRADLGLWFCILFFPYAIVYFLVRMLPKKGDLHLDAEGFQYRAALTFWKHGYRWEDVNHFYLHTPWYYQVMLFFAAFSSHYTSPSSDELVYFDVTINGNRISKMLTYTGYDISPEELVKLMNKWKEQYASC